MHLGFIRFFGFSVTTVCLLGLAWERPAQKLAWGFDTEGVQLGLGFEKTDFQAGGAIVATVVIKNTSDTVRQFPSYVASDQDYYFVVTRDLNEPIVEIPGIRAGSAVGLTMGPNVSKTNQVRVDAQFDLTRPGSYVVSVSRWIPSALGAIQLRSGNAIVNVRAARSETDAGTAVSLPGNVTPPGNNTPAEANSSDKLKSPGGIASPVPEEHRLSAAQKTGIGIIAIGRVYAADIGSRRNSTGLDLLNAEGASRWQRHWQVGRGRGRSREKVDRWESEKVGRAGSTLHPGPNVKGRRQKDEG